MCEFVEGTVVLIQTHPYLTDCFQIAAQVLQRNSFMLMIEFGDAIRSFVATRA